MARRATMINGERAAAKGREVLVLDAGDSLLGDREPAMGSQGATSIEAMNRMGYDAMVLGPADLSSGPAVVQQRIQEAKFTLLSADMTDSATQDHIAQPYVIKRVQGRQVAIIGLSGAADKNGFTATDAHVAVQRRLQELEGQMAAVILLSHAPPEVNERIADTVPGITAIIEGGAGLRAAPWVSQVTGTPIYHADAASSGHAGRVMGVATLTVAGGKLTAQTWRSVSLGPEIADDPAMRDWVQTVFK